MLVARRPALTRRFVALVAELERVFAQVGRVQAASNRQRPAIMNSEDNRNLILAIALSVLVLIGWQYFFAAPQLQKDRLVQQQAQTQSQTPATPTPGAAPAPALGANPLAPAGAPQPAAPKSRDEALGREPAGRRSTRRAWAARSTSPAA